jgi:hypothetical protein
VRGEGSDERGRGGSEAGAGREEDVQVLVRFGGVKRETSRAETLQARRVVFRRFMRLIVE